MTQRRATNGKRPLHRLASIGLAACLIAACRPIAARADGGTIRLSETKGDYRISVFTAPSPFRAGPVEISVLVQDAATGDALPDVKVNLRVASGERPSDTRQYAATSGAATNKLFHSAVFDLSRPGRWTVEVNVDGPRGAASTRFDAEAADRLPRWLSLWPWFSWPFLAVVLFALHQAIAVNRTLFRPRPAPRRSLQPRRE